MKINCRKGTFLLVLLFLNSISLLAQPEDFYLKKQFISGKDTLHYRMLMPKNMEGHKQLPLVLFLHGAGERGSDNRKQLSNGSALFYKMRDSFPALVIFPQCPEDDYWAQVEIDRSTRPLTLKFPENRPPTPAMDMVLKMVDELMMRPDVDKNKIYVGGLSMGGMGTFELLYRKPELFAAAFTICGAGNPQSTEAYAQTTPMWIFHGAQDDVVDPQASVQMVSGILKHGGTPNFSLFAKDNHNSWDSAFAEPELIPWLFSNSKSQ